jgi:hypothetical protein
MGVAGEEGPISTALIKPLAQLGVSPSRLCFQLVRSTVSHSRKWRGEAKMHEEFKPSPAELLAVKAVLVNLGALLAISVAQHAGADDPAKTAFAADCSLEELKKVATTSVQGASIAGGGEIEDFARQDLLRSAERHVDDLFEMMTNCLRGLSAVRPPSAPLN